MQRAQRLNVEHSLDATMVVGKRAKPASSYTVASMMYVGPYTRNMLRTEFNQLVNWAKENNIRTGKRIFYSLDDPGGRRPASKLRSEACSEIKGKARTEGKVKVKKS
jgi:DNA gyrase inhibitor GyrI